MDARRIPALLAALDNMAATLAQIDDPDPFTALNCSELDSIATVLAIAGHTSRAESIIALHAEREEPGDDHLHITALLGAPGKRSPELAKALTDYVTDELLGGVTVFVEVRGVAAHLTGEDLAGDTADR